MTHPNLIERLKPCPFCGGTMAAVSDNERGLIFNARCGRCGAAGPRERCAIDAKDSWNTRTNDQAISTLTAALEEARKRFQMIADFGDPYEINDEPEDFGGTDDGAETVCMAYENMQCIAENALRSIGATLKGEGDKTSNTGEIEA